MKIDLLGIVMIVGLITFFIGWAMWHVHKMSPQRKATFWHDVRMLGEGIGIVLYIIILPILIGVATAVLVISCVEKCDYLSELMVIIIGFFTAMILWSKGMGRILS